MYKLLVRVVIVASILGVIFTFAVQPLPETPRTPLVDIVGIILHTHFRTPFATTLVMVRGTTQAGHWRLQDLLERLLVKHGRGQLVVQLEGTSTTMVARHERASPPWSRSVLLVEGYAALRTIFEQLTLERFDFTGRYLIVLEDNSVPVTLAIVDRIFHDLWVRQIVNVVVAFRVTNDRSGPVQLWTYYPFSPGLCRVPKPHRLLTWPNDTILYGISFYPRKNVQFHGCPLRVGTFETRPFTIFRTLGVGGGGPPTIAGFEGDLLDSLAKRLNFGVDVRVTPRAQQWGVAAFENSTGLMRMLYTEEVDLGISCLGVSSERSAMLKAGKVHFTTELVIVVPPGRPYTAFEKLWQPYRASLWLALALVIGTGLCTIVTLHLMPSGRVRATIRHYLVGEGHVHNPSLNLIRVLFANALPRTPTGNFPRTLLFQWMVLCLLFNLLYQGSLFKYLQRVSHHRPMATLAEIDRSGALYHVSESAQRFFSPFPHRLARLRFFPNVPDSIGARLRWMGSHPDNPSVAMCTRDHVAYYNGQLRHGGEGYRRLLIARESMALYAVTILYPKRSMLTSSFDEHIERIDSSGLLKYWAIRYGDYRFFGSPQQAGRTEPTPISVGQLAGVLQELAALLFIALLAFVAELVWKLYTRHLLTSGN